VHRGERWLGGAGHPNPSAPRAEVAGAGKGEGRILRAQTLRETDAATFAFLNMTRVAHCSGEQLPGACSENPFLSQWC